MPLDVVAFQHLYQEILSHSDKQTLSKCLRLSKSTSDIPARLLYRTLEINSQPSVQPIYPLETAPCVKSSAVYTIPETCPSDHTRYSQSIKIAYSSFWHTSKAAFPNVKKVVMPMDGCKKVRNSPINIPKGLEHLIIDEHYGIRPTIAHRNFINDTQPKRISFRLHWFGKGCQKQTFSMALNTERIDFIFPDCPPLNSLKGIPNELRYKSMVRSVREMAEANSAEIYVYCGEKSFLDAIGQEWNWWQALNEEAIKMREKVWERVHLLILSPETGKEFEL